MEDLGNVIKEYSGGAAPVTGKYIRVLLFGSVFSVIITISASTALGNSEASGFMLMLSLIGILGIIASIIMNSVLSDKKLSLEKLYICENGIIIKNNVNTGLSTSFEKIRSIKVENAFFYYGVVVETAFGEKTTFSVSAQDIAGHICDEIAINAKKMGVSL